MTMMQQKITPPIERGGGGCMKIGHQKSRAPPGG